MLNFAKFFNKFCVVDTTSLVQTGDVLFPFAFDEVYGRRVGLGAEPVIHLWRHRKAFILGTRDQRLPYAAEAISTLTSKGCSVGIRNSGGAAVPLDAGVLNVSLIFPKDSGDLDFHADFQLMVHLLRETLLQINGRPVNVHQGQVDGAYCPGQFDLSIGGRKFAGIAQRRQIKAFIVQAFIVVEGSGAERAKMAAEFYQEASSGSRDLEYPVITRGSMGSLYETADVSSVELFVQGIKKAAAEMRQTASEALGEEADTGAESGKEGGSSGLAGTGEADLSGVKQEYGYRKEDDAEIRAMIEQLRERHG